MPIPRAPDQMGPQRAGQESGRSRWLPARLLGQGLGVLVVAEPPLGIRRRFVDAALVAAVESDAWAAGEDQPSDARGPAAFDHVRGAQRIGGVIVVPTHADAGHARRMKDHVHAAAGRRHRRPIAEIGADDFRAQGDQFRVVAPAESPHPVAAPDQVFHQRATEETAGAGDEGLHGRLPQIATYLWSAATCRRFSGILATKALRGTSPEICLSIPSGRPRKRRQVAALQNFARSRAQRRTWRLSARSGSRLVEG